MDPANAAVRAADLTDTGDTGEEKGPVCGFYKF